MFVGDPIIGVLVLAMAAGWDDRLATLVEDEVMEPVRIIGAVGEDLACLQSSDQVAGGSHVVLLAVAKLEAHRQVAPSPSRPRQPQHRIEKTPPIATRAALALPTSGHKGLQTLPLVVSQNPIFQG